jgi:transcriptional regulator with XRE-family HTH domain
MTKTRPERPATAAAAAAPRSRRRTSAAKTGSSPTDSAAAVRTTEPNVGAYLRLLRQEQGLTLADLTARSGVSRAMLSQIEQGRSSPSIALGWKIANGLGVPFGALLGEPVEGDFIVQRATQVREVHSSDRSMRSRALFPSGDRRSPELYELMLRPGGVEEAHPHALGTRELLYVGSGSLVVSSAGQRSELAVGDSLFFRADQPHRYENPGSVATQVYLVMCYPARAPSEEGAAASDEAVGEPKPLHPVAASPGKRAAAVRQKR